MKAARRFFQWLRQAPYWGVIGFGFLMVLTGFAANAFFGFYGIVDLKTEKTSVCAIPKTWGLCIVNAEHPETPSLFVEVPRTVLSGTFAKDLSAVLFSSVDLLVTLKRFIPHAEQRLKGLFEEKATVVYPGGVPSSIVFQAAAYLDPLFWNLNAIAWRMGALKTQEFGLAVAELSTQNRSGSPLFVLIEDGQEKEYVLMIGKRGEISLSSLDSHLNQSIVTFNEGRKGYAVEIPIPSGFVDEPYPGAFYLQLFSVPKAIPQLPQKERNTPCLYVEFSEGKELQVLPLVFDAHADSYQWSALNGKYLVRFQPRLQTLPFTIQVGKRECAHALSDPHAGRCRLDVKLGRDQEISLRQGAVASVGKGYRLSWQEERLEVRYSPARSVLILPGFFLLASGVLFMFFWDRTLWKRRIRQFQT